jgi:hypothetical protein
MKGRKPKFDWPALRPMMENLKYGQNKSLSQIAVYLHENYGKTVTQARLSQIYTGWKNGEQVNAN